MIQKLQELGLTEREAKVYIILLGKKSFTTSELQQLAIIPRTKMYEVLYKLTTKGICSERVIGRIKYYEAVEPKMAFERLIDEYNAEYQSGLLKRKSLINELKEMISPIFENSKDVVRPLEFVEIYKDLNQIQKKYVQALKDTKVNLLTFNKGPYVCDNPKRLKQQELEESDLIKRNVLCRNIYEERELGKYPWLRSYLKNLVKLGQQARLTKTLPIKMVVCDESTVIFPLLQKIGNSNNITMIFIQHHELALACKMLFNVLWEKSKAIK